MPITAPTRSRAIHLLAFAVLILIAGAAAAAKYPAIKVDDDPSVGKPDAPLVLIEFGHHL